MISWMEYFRRHLPKNVAECNIEEVKIAWRHYYDMSSELIYLRRFAVATKVIAQQALQEMTEFTVCFNWLSTFLPHYLTKVNRISFGLLSSNDYQATLLADPRMYLNLV